MFYVVIVTANFIIKNSVTINQIKFYVLISYKWWCEIPREPVFVNSPPPTPFGCIIFLMIVSCRTAYFINENLESRLN